MKIAEFCRVTGAHRSTVHHYLNLGLLAPPRTLGPKLRHFGPEHVERLRKIQALRAQGLGLAAIRERLGPMSKARPTRRPAPERPASPERGELRTEILDTAARLFLERGFEGVSVAEIAAAAGIGKATLYRHFPGKRELFVECLDRLRWTLVPAELRATLGGDLSPSEEARLRARAVLSHLDAYRSMTDLLGTVARGRRVDVAARAREALHRMVTNAEPTLKRAIATGMVRGTDSELVAYMLWGALLALGDRLMLDDRYDVDEVIEHYLEFIGLGPASSATCPGSS